MLEWVIPDGNPSGVVYGTIVTAALLAVESSRRESLPAAAGSVLLAVVILWLAHSYSVALGDRLHKPAPWTLRHLLDVARHEARLLQGAFLPVVVLLVSGAVGASDRTAVLAALIGAVMTLLGAPGRAPCCGSWIWRPERRATWAGSRSLGR